LKYYYIENEDHEHAGTELTPIPVIEGKILPFAGTA